MPVCRGTARLARELWADPELADRLEGEAAELKGRFNEDFWMPERQYFAVALDGEKRRVDTLTSNAGHLLWSGIVDDDKGEPVARQLMGDKLFSGWGVRTMAEGEGPYNPIEYHNGTVWPHDNSFIAAGLARYGYRVQAARIAAAMFDAAAFFDYRLPETFAGYPRERTRFPVEYQLPAAPRRGRPARRCCFCACSLGSSQMETNWASIPCYPRASRSSLFEEFRAGGGGPTQSQSARRPRPRPD
jgi:glycogen debranching enzyme